MDFFAVNGKRPVRLSEETRKFAFDSINHKYGIQTVATSSLSLDEYDGFECLSNIQKYDLSIEHIVKNAPLRICENEKVSGAATLGMAINHNVPVTYKGDPVFSSSISHLTIDFETVVKKGVNHILKQAEESLEKYRGTEKESFAQSCVHCLNCMKILHQRYLDELKDKTDYRSNYLNLLNVPFKPAKTFYEAVQSIWFTFAFVRLCGNWPGIGRIDYLLGEYLDNDLSNGTLTINEAREILAHFFIKGCEWVKGGNCGSGDAQHYQNILLAGVDENGNEVTNTVTYLVLDVLEELGISDFPTTVRINKNTDKKLLTRVSEVIRLGGGVIAVYNEDLIIESLVNYGYKLSDARKFANDGCWEVQIPGKTFFNYIPFDSLQILQKKTLNGYSEIESFSDYDSLYNAFIEDLKVTVTALISERNNSCFVCSGVPARDWQWKRTTPCTVVSIFEQGCIEKGLSYLEGGPIYNVISPHIGGLPDVVNSLYAIKKLVFDDKKISLSELLLILKSNWEGHEVLRRSVLNNYTYFGNDNDEVDSIAKKIIDDFSDICDSLQSAYKTPAGISTFGRQIGWSYHRFATPYGKKAQEVLSGNFSPTPGTDRDGATAIIKSYCKSDLRRTVSGAALDIKLLPSSVNGDNGIEAISSLIMGFVTLGGHFMQLDIADTELLKKAQENPDEYQNLSVRVSGWNARFVTLSRDWQDMIIQQLGTEI